MPHDRRVCHVTAERVRQGVPRDRRVCHMTAERVRQGAPHDRRVCNVTAERVRQGASCIAGPDTAQSAAGPDTAQRATKPDTAQSAAGPDTAQSGLAVSNSKPQAAAHMGSEQLFSAPAAGRAGGVMGREVRCGSQALDMLVPHGLTRAGVQLSPLVTRYCLHKRTQILWGLQSPSSASLRLPRPQGNERPTPEGCRHLTQPAAECSLSMHLASSHPCAQLARCTPSWHVRVRLAGSVQSRRRPAHLPRALVMALHGTRIVPWHICAHWASACEALGAIWPCAQKAPCLQGPLLVRSLCL